MAKAKASKRRGSGRTATPAKKKPAKKKPVAKKPVKKKPVPQRPPAAPPAAPPRVAAPPREAVQAVIKAFFGHLQAGDLAAAQRHVGHEYPDWDESIYTVWQDHYLIHATPKDSSFEGREWQNDTAWLRDLAIKDEFEWLSDDRVWVDFLYRGNPSGYIGEFVVAPRAGGFDVRRVIFRMA